MSKPTETPRERFLRVGGQRINKTLNNIRLIKQIAGKPYYKYTQPEIDAIFARLDEEIAEAKAAFLPTAPKEKPKLFDLAAVVQPSDTPLLEHIEKTAKEKVA